MQNNTKILIGLGVVGVLAILLHDLRNLAPNSNNPNNILFFKGIFGGKKSYDYSAPIISS
jgi:hypothetical protein